MSTPPGYRWRPARSRLRPPRPGEGRLAGRAELGSPMSWESGSGNTRTVRESEGLAQPGRLDEIGALAVRRGHHTHAALAPQRDRHAVPLDLPLRPSPLLRAALLQPHGGTG